MVLEELVADVELEPVDDDVVEALLDAEALEEPDEPPPEESLELEEDPERESVL